MSAMECSELALNSDNGADARERILSVSLSLFAMRGFEGVSTTQIAKAIGITQPLIHYHFKNKLTLWKESTSRLFVMLDKEFTQVVESLTIRDKKQLFIEVLRSYVSFCSKHPEFGQLIMREGAQKTERLEWLVREHIRPVSHVLYDIYLEGASEGWLKPIPYPQLMMMVTAMASNFFSLSPLVTELYNVDSLSGEESLAQSDAVVEVVLASIFKELVPGSKAMDKVKVG